MERFGRLGTSSTEFVCQLVASSIVKGANSANLGRKRVVKDRLHQIISVTTQVVISPSGGAVSFGTGCASQLRNGIADADTVESLLVLRRARACTKLVQVKGPSTSATIN